MRPPQPPPLLLLRDFTRVQLHFRARLIANAPCVRACERASVALVAKRFLLRKEQPQKLI